MMKQHTSKLTHAALDRVESLKSLDESGSDGGVSLGSKKRRFACTGKRIKEALNGVCVRMESFLSRST